MSKTRFTKEQVERLGLSSYVASVSNTTVRFTAEFKKRFLEERRSGREVREIFRECGIDPDILGEKRISGFCYQVNKKAKTDEDFSDKRGGNHRKKTEGEAEPVEQRLSRLENELAYTRQEVEFLKKLRAADMEARK